MCDDALYAVRALILARIAETLSGSAADKREQAAVACSLATAVRELTQAMDTDACCKERAKKGELTESDTTTPKKGK